MASQSILIRLTKEQRAWIDIEAGKTMDSFSSIVRNLIQNEIKQSPEFLAIREGSSK